MEDAVLWVSIHKSHWNVFSSQKIWFLSSPMVVGRIFSRRESKVVRFDFSPSKLRKQLFFAENFKILATRFRRPCPHRFIFRCLCAMKLNKHTYYNLNTYKWCFVAHALSGTCGADYPLGGVDFLSRRKLMLFSIFAALLVFATGLMRLKNSKRAFILTQKNNEVLSVKCLRRGL